MPAQHSRWRLYLPFACFLHASRYGISDISPNFLARNNRQILQWRMGRAIDHVRSGIKILAEHQAETQGIVNITPPIVPLQQLITVIRQLKTQLYQLMQPVPHLIIALGDPPALPVLQNEPASAPTLTIPHFNNLDDAWTSLSVHWYKLMHLVSRNSENGPASQTSEVVFSLQRLDVLRAAWDWKSECSSTTETELGRLSGDGTMPFADYEVRLINGTQFMTTGGEMSETSWDTFTTQFHQVLDLAKAVAEEEKLVVRSI